MEILIKDKQTRIEIDQTELTRKARILLEDLGCSPSAMLSIVLVASDEMAELNYAYRGKEGPTNVLSFPQSDPETSSVQPDLLGDVVICSDRVVQDAENLGYSNDEMITYLLIHGVLHLKGLTHYRPQDAQSMESQVEEIFQRFHPLPTDG